MTEIGTPRKPVHIKQIRQSWGEILMAIGLTVAVVWLQVKAQRLSADPDGIRTMTMWAANYGEKLGNQITRAGVKLSMASAKIYDEARYVSN